MGRILPKYLSQWMTQKVKNEGVNVEAGCTLSSAHLERGKVILTLSNGREIKVDHVIMSVGSEPNIQLAESAKLETAQGGFKVNSEFKAKYVPLPGLHFIDIQSLFIYLFQVCYCH
ncbi:Uncharacterized protein FKW44_001673 [Caligus rogercresseyi]|uniref:FAD/NAD(P)-binding domain-containing protein n=1 Tax=Caligus rogercresseyi TaxID=217165 RepID=A0A7T8KJA8_CALRO|nr:Uncharacterized protein FKW44_001673 [Caligus rogercresseyi]